MDKERVVDNDMYVRGTIGDARIGSKSRYQLPFLDGTLIFH